MSQIKKLLGKRIKEIRLAKGLTQEQLAELVNVASTSISKIENGLYHPTDENLEKISQALEIEPYKLYKYNHHKNVQELKKEIINKIEKANDEEIKLIYRIFDGLFV